MSFITEDFLLENQTARDLYRRFAEDLPIFDYHCHLSEKAILENKPFNDLYEVWLSGDHYKWRLMRNHGVDENLITGNASNKEKFIQYCKTIETAFDNPLYHWSQYELDYFFGCKYEINSKNAELIWDYCNKVIKENVITPQKLIEGANVAHIFTTNEIFDDLSTFDEIKKKYSKFTVKPAFRADKLMNISATNYVELINKLGKVQNLNELQNVIETKLNKFIGAGCVATDIAVEQVYLIPSFEEANSIFVKRMNGGVLDELESQKFIGYLTYYLLKLYSSKDLRCELHIGALRNNNSIMFDRLGADTGFDCIGEATCIKELSLLMNRLNNESSLPRMIIFNLNPKMNTEILTLIGCFQGSCEKGKIQYGASWWFLDNKDRITQHFKDLASLSHLDSFIGMLTDSRSFLSYTRHQYFRRLLCNYLGTLMEKEEMTKDLDIVKKVIENICYVNAFVYFGGPIWNK